MAENLLNIAKRLEERPATERGWKFLVGPTQPRSDVLNKEIEEVYLKLRGGNKKEPTAREVFGALEPGKYIQEVDVEDSSIFWTNRTNKEKKTTFKSFKNRLTRIKKKFKINNIS